MEFSKPKRKKGPGIMSVPSMGPGQKFANAEAKMRDAKIKRRMIDLGKSKKEIV